MRFTAIIIPFLIFKVGLLSCQAFSTTSPQAIDSVEAKAKKLKQYYLLSKSSVPEVADMYQDKFFDEFPNTFKQLNQLYGYDGQAKKGAILYYDAGNHIMGLFNNLKNINDTLYYKKIIGITIGGKWDADAVNFFQHGLQEHIVAKPELAVFILKKMDKSTIKSFWYFYFVGPIPKNHFYPSLEKIKMIDKDIYKLMMESYNQVSKVWEKE